LPAPPHEEAPAGGGGGQGLAPGRQGPFAFFRRSAMGLATEGGLMRTPLALLAAVFAIAACHPTAEEFAAKELEADKYKKSYEDESQKATDLEAKVKSLEEAKA